MDHSRKMLSFRDMLLFLNPPTQHEALLRARSASLRCARKYVIRISISILIKTQNIFLDNLAVVLSQRINGIYPHFLT